MNQQLGKYTIIEELGRGGFGTVYKAQDPIGRMVALKVLHTGYNNDQEAVTRFRQEALAAGSLFHQRIATILDIEESDGYLFLVMRFVDGKNLRSVLKEKGPLPWEEAKKIVLETAEALLFAHQSGFIHRDVKPENILINTSGIVLTDFGLTKAIETSTLSITKGAMGTMQYIAPEIWLGQKITPKVDVYSLACVLHEIVSGESLFTGDSAPALMTQHLMTGAQIPEKYPDGCPLGLGELLKAGLVKEPEKRLDLETFAQKLNSLGNQKEEKIFEKETATPVIQTNKIEPQAGKLKKIDLGDGLMMEFVYVPAGEFWMGADEGDQEARELEKPKHKVYIDAYWIGKYPVTNEQYACFVKKSGYKTPSSWKSKQIPPGKENHPVVEVSWSDVQKFNEWVSQQTGLKIHLPTEAQWEKAARGTDGRRYPWGNDKPTSAYANYGSNEKGTTPVGYYEKGKSPYGCYDMAGNVWEWVMDWFNEGYYKKSPQENPEGPVSGTFRVLRGGSWYDNEGLVRFSFRVGNYPEYTNVNLGFRCALSFVL